MGDADAKERVATNSESLEREGRFLRATNSDRAQTLANEDVRGVSSKTPVSILSLLRNETNSKNAADREPLEENMNRALDSAIDRVMNHQFEKVETLSDLEAPEPASMPTEMRPYHSEMFLNTAGAIRPRANTMTPQILLQPLGGKASS
jgi:hypothetical protein